jgi:hypothetical protein
MTNQSIQVAFRVTGRDLVNPLLPDILETEVCQGDA